MGHRPPPSGEVAVIAWSLFALACVTATVSAAGEDAQVRAPAWVGSFYPAEAPALRQAIRAYLEDAVPARAERPLVLLAPHAAYAFSGQIAADAYRQLDGHTYDLVVILGTDHGGLAPDRAAIHPGQGFRTPLGVAPIDRATAASLIAADAAFVFDAAPHEREHSVEVQVPFVQVALPGARILPIVVGASDPMTHARIGRALAAVLAGRQALLVASSDLSHFPAYDDAVASDHAILRAVAGLDTPAFREAAGREMRVGRAKLATCACGEAPLTVAMETARALGATHGLVLSYANSGDSGLPDRSRVVGYGAVAFVAGAGGADVGSLERRAPPPAETPLDAADEKQLLDIARRSIRRLVETLTLPLVRGVSARLLRPQGTFVTLRKNGALRGCRGTVEPALPLGQAVGALAVQAAFNDRRFAPLQASELGELRIEVSLLSALTPVRSPDAIVVGRDGLVLRSDGHTGVFLPEVAIEQGWSRGSLLEEIGLKAGLARDAWRKAELLTFRTSVVREPD